VEADELPFAVEECFCAADRFVLTSVVVIIGSSVFSYRRKHVACQCQSAETPPATMRNKGSPVAYGSIRISVCPKCSMGGQHAAHEAAKLAVFQPQRRRGSLKDFRPSGMQHPASDVLSTMSEVRKKFVDVSPQLPLNQVGDLWREDDSKAFFRYLPPIILSV